MKPKTWATLSAISVNKKNTMLISILKRQKTSDSLGNIYVNDWKENEGKIGINTLYLILVTFKN